MCTVYSLWSNILSLSSPSRSIFLHWEVCCRGEIVDQLPLNEVFTTIGKPQQKNPPSPIIKLIGACYASTRSIYLVLSLCLQKKLFCDWLKKLMPGCGSRLLYSVEQTVEHLYRECTGLLSLVKTLLKSAKKLNITYWCRSVLANLSRACYLTTYQSTPIWVLCKWHKYFSSMPCLLVLSEMIHSIGQVNLISSRKLFR